MKLQVLGFGYTERLARDLGISRRAVSYHLKKFEEMGYFERFGGGGCCCFQAWRIHHRMEVPAARIMETWAQFESSGRMYFSFDWNSATLPASGVSSCVGRRVLNRSVPWGAPGGNERLDELRPHHFWVPFQLIPRMLSDLDTSCLNWSFDLEDSLDPIVYSGSVVLDRSKSFSDGFGYSEDELRRMEDLIFSEGGWS